MKMTPIDALIHQVWAKPEGTAFVFRREAWTYQRLAAVAEHLACGLIKRGIKQGDRVALHMMNRPEMIIAYYACFQTGAIAAPLRTAFKPAELAPLLQRLKPALYIGEAGLYENVSPIETSILALEKRVIVGEIAESCGVQPWRTLFCGVTEEPVAMMMFLARTVRSPTCTLSLPMKVAWPFSHSIQRPTSRLWTTTPRSTRRCSTRTRRARRSTPAVQWTRARRSMPRRQSIPARTRRA